MSKCVVIGVTGGIAVYKALDVISALRKKDIEVHVIMTESASKFVNPLTFQSISQNMVVTDMFAEPKAWEIQHISLAQKADLMLIAPATANVIGKISNGIADDMLSTTVMATKAKVLIAPAMNTNMYQNPIVQNNISKLKDFGYKFIEPASGRLACGDIGIGKLADVNTIVERVIEELEDKEQDLLGKKVLVSAGPTIAPIDPVRYKTNEEMKKEILQNFKWADIVIKSAAVADYKPKEYSKEKIKKGEGDLNICLTRDNDILKFLGEIKTHQVLVGFAAESDNVLENAERKLKNKNLDFIVANDITSSDTGFGSEDNKVVILSKNNEKLELEKMSKKKVASNIFDMILEKR